MSRGFLNSRTNKYRISKTNNIFIISGSYIILVMKRKQLKTRIILTILTLLLSLSLTLAPPQEKVIDIEKITNSIKIGKLAGNRNLEFGVRNVLEEYLFEVGYDLNPNAPLKLQVELVFLDVLRTKRNFSVLHRNNESVVIRLKGTLFRDGKKIKEVSAEESSSEISISTVIIDNGGQFNQTSLSNAIKKACETLILELEKS
jgi:hypothetical protein